MVQNIGKNFQTFVTMLHLSLSHMSESGYIHKHGCNL